ncbi:MAG: hypothetical protein LUQ09_04715 [Methanomassiliicoccales archaeon]|nr:hypothetical protein [Methanomassiliicoccales archaeon]
MTIDDTPQEEDSKEMAHAGSAGVEWDLTWESGLTEEEMRQRLEEWLTLISKELIGAGPMLGHIKAIFKCKDGWMRVNLVDPRLKMDVDGDLKGAVQGGRMKVMAALVGKNDEQVMDGLLKGTGTFLKGQDSNVRIIRTTKKDNIIRMEGLM